MATISMCIKQWNDYTRTSWRPMQYGIEFAVLANIISKKQQVALRDEVGKWNFRR